MAHLLKRAGARATACWSRARAGMRMERVVDALMARWLGTRRGRMRSRMLYHFLVPLAKYHIVFNVFRYITFRTAMAAGHGARDLARASGRG